MNAIKNIYAVLALIALCLSSCEMKNELEGKYNLKNDEGLLTLDLVNKTQATPTTKAESTSLTDELDVNTYKVEIVDNATEAVVRSFASYAKLKEALPLVVPVGNYKIVAKSGVLQDASRTPYFEGSSSIEVKQGMESKAEVLCKSATVKVSLNISEDFLKYYSDCTVSLSTSHLTAPFEVNMKKDSGKDAYLKANADGEKVSITVGGFRDKEGNEVVMEALVAEKKVAPKTHLTITVDPEVITISTGTASLDVTVDTGTEDKDVNIEIPEEYWPGNASK